MESFVASRRQWRVPRQAEGCVEGECIMEEFLDFEGID